MQLYKTIFKLDFQPVAANIMRLPELASRLEDFPHLIAAQGAGMVVGNYSRHYSVILGQSSIIYDEDHCGDRQFIEIFPKVLDAIEKLGTIKEFVRIGCRRKFLQPTTMTMVDLVQVMDVKLHVQKPQLQDIFPQKKGDLAYFIDYIDGKRKLNLRAAPCEKHELPGALELNKELHYARNPSEYGEIIDSLPEVSIYYDLDVFRAEQKLTLVDAKQATYNWWNEIDSKIAQLDSYLLNRS